MLELSWTEGITMKKVIGINGSPRMNWNSAKMLDSALKGASEAGYETKRIDLYKLNYTGCRSCCYNRKRRKSHRSYRGSSNSNFRIR